METRFLSQLTESETLRSLLRASVQLPIKWEVTRLLMKPASTQVYRPGTDIPSQSVPLLSLTSPPARHRLCPHGLLEPLPWDSPNSA